MENKHQDPYTDRMCCDCIYCDIMHRHCRMINKPTVPTMVHPKDRVCPYYYELLQAAEDGYFKSPDIEHTFEETNPTRGVLPTSRMKI